MAQVTFYYAKESIMFLLNVTFTPRYNIWINKPKMDWASCLERPLKIEDPR
jgi:hypothetical protein